MILIKCFIMRLRDICLTSRMILEYWQLALGKLSFELYIEITILCTSSQIMVSYKFHSFFLRDKHIVVRVIVISIDYWD